MRRDRRTAASGDGDGKVEAALPVQMARAVAPSGARGWVEAAAVRMARAVAPSGASGWVEAAAVQMARAVAPSGAQERVEMAPLAQATADSDEIRQAEEASLAPIERVIVSRRQVCLFRKRSGASSGCWDLTKSRNRAGSNSASPTARRRK